MADAVGFDGKDSSSMNETRTANAAFGIRRIWTALLVAASLAIAVAGFGVNAPAAQAAITYHGGISEPSPTVPRIGVVGISLGDDGGRNNTNGRSWR